MVTALSCLLYQLLFSEPVSLQTPFPRHFIVKLGGGSSFLSFLTYTEALLSPSSSLANRAMEYPVPDGAIDHNT